MANRVGIVTWYSYENYGTVLQAVALNKAVQQLGYDAIDISYDPALGRLSHEAGDGSLVVRIKNKAKYLYGLCPLQNEVKSQLFSTFIRDNLSLTEPVEAKADLRQFNHCLMHLYAVAIKFGLPGALIQLIILILLRMRTVWCICPKFRLRFN